MSLLDKAPPPRDRAFRCSPWTRSQGVDPIGSVGTYDAFLLVEVPPPWPKDVSEVPILAATAEVAEAEGRTRVLAVHPDPERRDGLVGVTAWRRTGTHTFAGTDHEVARAALPDVFGELLRDPAGSPGTATAASPPELLICSHGKRDACCGRFGTLLHAEVAARWSGMRVRRCSHTGGHRFAPTGFSFPEGRGWAYVDAEVLDRVVGRNGDVADLHEHQRGTTALDEWGQVLERAVFEELGWSWLDCTLTDTHVEVAESAEQAQVELAWTAPEGATGRASALVEVTRTVPVLVCGQPPEAARKASPERSLRRVELTVEPPRDRTLRR